MPVLGGTTLKLSNAPCPQRRNAYRSRLRWNSSSALRNSARLLANSSTWTERVDLARNSAEVVHGVAHGCQVDDCRDAREVLQEDAARRERDLLRRLGR